MVYNVEDKETSLQGGGLRQTSTKGARLRLNLQSGELRYRSTQWRAQRDVQSGGLKYRSTQWRAKTEIYKVEGSDRDLQTGGLR